MMQGTEIGLIKLTHKMEQVHWAILKKKALLLTLDIVTAEK
jgi:hypothetical protein